MSDSTPLPAPPAADVPPAVTGVGPASPRRRAWAAAGALGGLVLLSWALEARVWLRATDAEDYRTAAELVRKDFQPGDAFTAVPNYALRSLEGLGDLRSLGAGAALAGMALGVRDLWVVAEPASDTDQETLDRAYGVPEVRPAGKLTVLRYRLAPAAPWHAADAMGEAEVRLFKAGGPAEGLWCNQVHRRYPGFTCQGEPDWMRATVEWMDLAGVASGGDRAIWMHPPGGTDRKEYTWRGVTMGRTLVLGASHTEYGARNARAPVRLVLRVGARVLLEKDYPPHLGWQVDRLVVPPELAGAQDVTVAVSSTNNSAAHFAVDLGVRP